jgi:hypothetical protein
MMMVVRIVVGLEKDDDDDKQQKADAVYAYTTSVCFVDDG